MTKTAKFALAVLVCVPIALAQDMGVARKMSENKFAPLPNLPACITLAVQSGDPSKGASVILFKGTAGCSIPWHWHTPIEHVMIVSGSVKVEMKGGATSMLGPAGYSMMPSKHVHQFTCISACTAFLTSNAAFDIHYVDANGTEIPTEQALAKKK